MRSTAAVGFAVGFGAMSLAAASVLRSARTIQLAERTVVIVGGSRGLGLVMAREFAAEGAHLVLLARDEAELDRALQDLNGRGFDATAIACDVTERLQIEHAVDRIVAERGTIDVLINNAGVIQVGPMAHMTVADFEQAMATHFWGPLHTILAALPHMRRAGAQRIVNISSIGGKIAVPHLLPYSASKFALTGLSEGLRSELASEGFRVTTVCPGLMRTGSTYNAEFKGQHRREFAWFHLADSIPGLSVGAQRAARRIVDAVRHGDAEVVISAPAKLAVLLNGVSPALMATALTAGANVLPAADENAGGEARSGWQSVSDAVPSALTALADRATLANNEVPSASQD